MTVTSNGTGFYGQMKLKMSFLAANTQDGFGVETGIKKYPMCKMKYTAVFFMLWAYISCWRSWTSCLDTRHHGFYQIPTDKKSISDDPVRNLIMAMFGSSNRTIIKHKPQKQHKNGSLSTNQASAMAIPVL